MEVEMQLQWQKKREEEGWVFGKCKSVSAVSAIKTIPPVLLQEKGGGARDNLSLQIKMG
jgi:hypothetical protein